MGPLRLGARHPALVLRGDIPHLLRDLHQLVEPVVGLSDDALVRLRDVVLEADLVLEAERRADCGRPLDGPVVRGVGQVEPDQGRAAVLPGKEPCREKSPQHVERIVVAHEDGDLELHVDAELVQEITGEHRSPVEVEDLLDAVRGVVVKVLIKPLAGVVVRLADAAEVSGDCVRPAKVDVRSVSPPRIQGFHPGGAENLHAGGDGRQVPVLLLLFHCPHADEAAGHELSPRDGLPRLGNEPREVLKGGNLQSHLVAVVLERGRSAGLLLELFQRDELSAVFLLDQPRKVFRVARALCPHHFQEIFQPAVLPGRLVD